jgi:gamma-glutamyltranspeptidase/glutathione hydrolase
MCGVGGDLFALIQRPDGQTVALNASGRSPAGIDADAVRARHRHMPDRGPDVVTVPGAVSGWDALHREGGILPWADAFTAAIAYAHGGVAVSRSLDTTLREVRADVADDPGLAAVFFPAGAPLGPGDPFVQPALGASLQAIAAYGPTALYGGDVGRRLASGLAAVGSALTVADLEAHRADVVAPLVGRFRDDLDVRVAPPNSQGFVLLEILELVDRMGIDRDPSGSDAGTLALIFSAAARDRDLHLADPDAMRVHPSTLLDDGHLAALSDGVRERYAATPASALGDTIALVAADARGWAVSLIQSLAAGFGSGILEPATGIVPQNRGAGFTLDAAHPNALSPRKRPAHTLMPVLVHRGDRLAAVAGTMGGYAQPQINAENLLRAFGLRRSAADVLSEPRWLVGGMDVEAEPPFVLAERGLPGIATEAIERAGYRIESVDAPSGEVGHAHLIIVGADGRFDAASDPRADGAAMAS